MSFTDYFTYLCRYSVTCLVGLNDLKPQIKGILRKKNVWKYRMRGHFVNLNSMASKKRCFFQVSLKCLGVIFQFHLQCLGVVCKSGRQVHRELMSVKHSDVTR